MASATLHLRPPPPSAAAAAAPRLPLFPSKPTSTSTSPPLPRRAAPLSVSSQSQPSPAAAAAGPGAERVFFDGGAHYGDLVANILMGFTLLWLPLTLAAVFRAFFLRYRFTDRRVTVVSGLTGQDRSDFPYSSIRDVQTVPRFIGNWGDIVITLKDGTKVDLRSVPKFREIAEYCLFMADESTKDGGGGARGF